MTERLTKAQVERIRYDAESWDAGNQGEVYRLAQEWLEQRAALEQAKESLVALLDITRVVVTNQYGSAGFQHETAVRNVLAEDALAEVRQVLP